MSEDARRALDLDQSKYDFKTAGASVYRSAKGLTRETILDISAHKKEPEWMRDARLHAYEVFLRKPMPEWGGDLSEIDFGAYTYYIKPSEKREDAWADVPDDIRKTFDRLGVPEAERKFLAGVGAQFESEMVYHSIQEELSKKGVIFLDTESGLRQHPELFRKYFASLVPPEDNKFAALNTACWSGGSFIYVPKGVKLDIPLQAYFRINSENMGQFERTIIIADEGSDLHYIEGCTAPQYSTRSLHTGVIEIFVHRGARVRYSTIQNWAHNIYNLVTQRAIAYEDATMEWVDGNMGCLAGGSRVFTGDGMNYIENIKPGDTVQSLSSGYHWVPQRVVATKKNPPLPTYRMTTVDHREITATGNHPFLALRKVGRLRTLRWLPLTDISPGDEIALSGLLPDNGAPWEVPDLPRIAHARNPFRAPRATTDGLMWFLGFYLGDGLKERARVVVCVPESDPAEPRVRASLASLFGIEQTTRHGVQLRVNSIGLSRFIDAVGFSGNAASKRLPEWVYSLPASQKRALIEGYVAADGHIRPNHTNMSITSANRALLEDIKAVALACGLNPLKISTWSRREKKPLGIEEKLYTSHFLYFGERAPESPVYFSEVLKIEGAGEQVTYDIEVGKTANFVANGIVAHNSRLTMKYPSIYLAGERARGNVLSIAFATSGQHQDAGTKIIHMAPHTTSTILSKSISRGTGRTSYRGLLKVAKGATGVKASVKCDALMLSGESRSDTYPTMEIDEDAVAIAHEATVGKISDDQIFYMMSRGLSEQDATAMIVQGFIEPFAKQMPMEYAIELNRLIQLEMEGAVG